MNDKTKNNTYIFSEDARKWRKWMLLFSIIFYICFIIFIFSIIFPDYFLLNQYISETKIIIYIIGFLISGILGNCSYASKYLKYYMFISDKEMIFFAEKKSHKYKITDLKDYEIIKARKRYTVYKLKFKDENSYIITTFKNQEFKKTIDKILQR